MKLLSLGIYMAASENAPQQLAISATDTAVGLHTLSVVIDLPPGVEMAVITALRKALMGTVEEERG